MAAKRKPATEPAEAPTLEKLLTSVDGFGLQTATPVQRAKCRIVQGLPLAELADHPRVVAMVGGAEAAEYLRGSYQRPRAVYDVSGIRGAKSLLIAAVAVFASQTVRIEHLGAGEIPRYSILSTSLDIAQVSFNDHLVGKIMASPVLKGLVLDEPKSDSLLLRHPSGRPVEVKIVAGARAGSTLVARWSIGMAADEAPRMHGDEAVVNFEDSVRAIDGRLLDGAQILAPGSPWAPSGPVYDATMARFGKPGVDLVVLRAPAYDLNPIWWTPERCAAFKASNPDAYQTDVEAQFGDPDSAMYPSVEVERASKRTALELPPRRGVPYAAAMDPATRGNAWTLCIGHSEGGRLVIDCARQWQGSKASPLDPDEVLREQRALLARYHLDQADTDQLGYDFVAALARQRGLTLVLVPWGRDRTAAYDALRRRLATSTIELPPDPMVRADLIGVRRRLTTTGVSVHLPLTGDGRHADYAPPLARLAARYLDEASEAPAGPVLDEDEQAMLDEQEREAEERLGWM